MPKVNLIIDLLPADYRRYENYLIKGSGGHSRFHMRVKYDAMLMANRPKASSHCT